MENEILKTIASQGAFAVLFAYMLFHVLKTSAEREERLMSFTQEMTEKLAAVSERLAIISDKTNQIPVLAERLTEVEKSVERLVNR
ncbi:hypothetical protein Desku_1098 [Desulfofundulus kuznetsovii DSM 6115]|uniref:Bacteriocin UviB n=1 Tax=Desulfofundulus kuznetsovii (strain DSM 6115 / VKM B-1805 / 17) TaxID=760568 RepID=A0AAU8P9R9_DESK7|nr:hypothetical protein Desku_1098 [Desulfofundulus kuznetsovii DSM 6115]